MGAPTCSRCRRRITDINRSADPSSPGRLLYALSCHGQIEYVSVSHNDHTRELAFALDFAFTMSRARNGHAVNFGGMYASAMKASWARHWSE